MAKVNDLKNSFSTSRKIQTALSTEDIDRIAEGLETPTLKVAASPLIKVAEKITVIPTEELVKTSLDFPLDLYKDMKINLIGRRQSMKEYLLDLIRRDLYGKGK